MTVLEAGRKARVPIRTRCGGKASCLMCKVIARQTDGLSPANRMEKWKLGDQLHQGYRLACQTRIYGKAEVEIPEHPLKSVIRAQLAELRGETDI
jgi:2Fe-2S ferredoxin